MSETFTRGELHIFTDNPMDYALPQGTLILVTYADTMDYISENKKVIYTTQLSPISSAHSYSDAGS